MAVATSRRRSWLSPRASSKLGLAAIRQACRERLGSYGAWVHDKRPARHHRIWIDAVTALIAGQSERRKLLIVAPPGTAKSTWLSLIFPTWYLGNHPDHALLFLTTSDTNAYQFGTTVKLTLEGNARHVDVFPEIACRPEPSRGWSSDGLYLRGTPRSAKDPAYRAMGFGASSLGARVHGLILDDPLTEEASKSPTEQDKALTYHDMTVDTRLHPGGWEILISTRWHDRDLPGRLMDRAQWDVVVLPALDTWGDDSTIWPERITRASLVEKRIEIGPPKFNAVFQCDPTSLGGTVFKSLDWFRPLPDNFRKDILPTLRLIQFWDLAFSARSSADYTAAVTVGIDKQQNVYVLHAQRARIDAGDDLDPTVPRALDDFVLAHIRATLPHLAGVEEAAYRAGVTRDLIARLARRAGLTVPITAVKVDTDKVYRAQLPAGRAALGMVFCDTDAPWFPDFVNECLAFPLGAHDDYVDAFGGAVALGIQVSAQPKPRAVTFESGT